MGAGRKLKSHPGNEWKKPFAGSSHAKGIVLEKMLIILPSLVFHLMHLIFEFEYDILLDISTDSGIEAKQPNSAIRKCERVQLIKYGKDCSLCSQSWLLEENVDSRCHSLQP